MSATVAVAELVYALDCGSRSCGFESRRSPRPCGVTASIAAFQAVDTGSIPVTGLKNNNTNMLTNILKCIIILNVCGY